MNLSREERIRYHRHIILNEFGEEGQLKLRNARILVVGAGGLGSPVLLYLAAAGVGTLGIVDNDVIDVTNLQRQILFTNDDVGKSKAEQAAHRLRMMNPHIECVVFNMRITSQNALNIINQFDLVIDGTDNFPTRYLLNDACVLLDKPLVYGSILRFEGQVSVFNAKTVSGRSANYRDLFPAPPPASAVPDCSTAGVLGVLPGIIGSLQANEAIKLVTGLGDPLVNKLLILDSLSMDQHIITYRDLNARDQIKALIDYDEFCISAGKKESLGHSTNNNTTMKEVTVQELKQMMDEGKSFQLIDVREPHEYDICNLGGELIPQGDIPSNVERVSKDRQVVIHCRSGARSGNMVQWLEANHGFTNLYNLKGGILEWAREIDPEMPTY